jgi:HEAT repeat protein
MSEQTTTAYLSKPVDHWTEMLKSPDPLQRRLAVYALGEIGPAALEAAPALTEALNDEQSFVRVWAASALARVETEDPAPALSALVAGMSAELAFVRSLAVWHLGRLDADTPGLKETEAEMKKLLGDVDPSVRVEAAMALKRLHTQKIMLTH